MLKNSSGVKFKKDFVFNEFRLIRLCYECTCKKGKQTKKPDAEDIEKWKVDEYKKHFYPEDDFFGQEPKRNYKKGIKKVYQLYSKRNLSALSIFSTKLMKLKTRILNNFFLLFLRQYYLTRL